MPTAQEYLELIEATYPDLWVRTYSFNDKGQNNDVLIINEDVIFRFPRTLQAARHLRLEVAILGRLQDRVTLRVPDPLYVSLDPSLGRTEPGDRSPVSVAGIVRGPGTRTRRAAAVAGAAAEAGTGAGAGKPPVRAARAVAGRHIPGVSRKAESGAAVSAAKRVAPRGVFVGYRRIPGEPLWRDHFLASGDETTVQGWADQLAVFLKELHATPPEGELAVFLGHHDGRERWTDFYGRVRGKIFPHMRPDARKTVARDFEAFLGAEASFAYQPALVHGDFGPSNILFEPATRRLSGVIDFGSAGLDDPAVDMAALMGPFGYGGTFVRRLGRRYPLTPETLARASFYASTFTLQDAVFGVENADVEAFEWGMKPYR